MMRAASTSLASALALAVGQRGDVGADVGGRERARILAIAARSGTVEVCCTEGSPAKAAARRGAGQRGGNNQHLRFHVFGKRGRSAVHDTLLARASRAGIEWGDCTGPPVRCLEDSSMRNIAPRDASELEALEQREWLESLDYVIQQGDRGRVQRLLGGPAPPRPHAGRRAAVHGRHALRQHHPARGADAAARQPGDRAADQEPRPLERDGDGRARQPRTRTASAATSRPTRRRRRSTRSASTISSAARTATATATSSTSRATRRPASTRARSSKGGCRSRSCSNFRRELRRGRRPVVVPAPVADAGLLGVPDGVDGPRPDHVDLPGALQPLPGGPRPEEAVGRRRSGRSSATARPTSPSRSARSASRRARSSTT